MRVLYIGGTGEISYSCVQQGLRLGQQITVFNRSQRSASLPPQVQQISGNLNDDAAYAALAVQPWDVVCQFLAYDPKIVERDIAVFRGRIGQYVFISSASAYQKPPQRWLITEDVPLENPYWPYSRAKAAMETILLQAHHAGHLPVTIIRPSHTYRLHVPIGIFVSGDHNAWRLLQNRPVIVPGDGTSLWTMTHADDFAVPFNQLLGNPRALGEAFHITAHQTAYPWDQIIETLAQTLGVQARLVHIPTDALVRHNPDWAGPLRGDKIWSTVFDNSKVFSVAGPFTCKISLAEGFQHVAAHFQQRLARGQYQPDSALHEQLDRLAAG